jgi:hypothetical protein
MGFLMTDQQQQYTSLTAKPVTSLDELLAVWPMIVEDDPEMGSCVPLLMRCVADGLLLVMFFGGRFVGITAIEMTEGPAVVHILPKEYGRQAIRIVKEWAFELGINELQITSSAVTGSQFRFFEKTLGFRRKAIIFTMQLWQTQKS